MSPITAAARERLEAYVQAQRAPSPPPTPNLLRQLIDNLVMAVRAEQPGDNQF